MNSKIMFDTEGLEGIITSISAEIDKYSLSAENLNKSFEDVSKYWIGPDYDQYNVRVVEYLKTVQMLKLTLQDFEETISKLKNKISNYQGF